jgi:hypothetical protein
VSPPKHALVDRPDRRNDTPSATIELATDRELAGEQTRHDRRAHKRHRHEELRWIRQARLSAGPAVSIVDLSSGGALVDSPVALRPDSVLTLDIEGRGFDKTLQFRVIRCEVGTLRPGQTIYRGACEFTTSIELPAEHAGTARVLFPNQFVGVDVALEQLVERAGAGSAFGSLDAGAVKQSLTSLRDRANTPLDPIGHTLAGLLDHVLPALDKYVGIRGVIKPIEAQLRQTVPQVTLRLVLPTDSPAAGAKSVLVNVPGAPAAPALVSIDLPRGVVLNSWQSRVLRVATRLIALLQRLEPAGQSAPQVPRTAAPASAAVDIQTASELVDAPAAGGWQKIVVRYVEGQVLKGYTQDFSAARAQFSLWPSLASPPNERVIVPLARLKGVFFVRDFAGNPGYIERSETEQSQHGRRIEVTLVDHEVIAGRTLTYRPDGHGFFVMPADPLANNIRVFIVASAVRQVRFP